MRLLRRRRDTRAVIAELIEGLENGTITLDASPGPTVAGGHLPPADPDRLWHLTLMVAAIWAAGITAVFVLGFPSCTGAKGAAEAVVTDQVTVTGTVDGVLEGGAKLKILEQYVIVQYMSKEEGSQAERGHYVVLRTGPEQRCLCHFAGTEPLSLQLAKGDRVTIRGRFAFQDQGVTKLTGCSLASHTPASNPAP